MVYYFPLASVPIISHGQERCARQRSRSSLKPYPLSSYHRLISLSRYRFYVNLLTERSQWERPTAPAAAEYSAPPPPRPDELPPSYLESGPASSSGTPGIGGATGDMKKNPHDPALGSNNPFYSQGSGKENPAPPISTDDDARLAAQLQAEEDARAAASSQRQPDGRSPIPGGDGRGYDASGSSPQSLPPRPEEERGRSSGGGFLGKLLDKAKGAHSSGSSSSPFSRPPPGLHQPGYGYGHQPVNPYMQGGAGYYPPHPPQQMGGPYGYGGGYGGYGGGYGGYPPQAMGRPQRRGGGGMGTAGAAALGVGGGLLGGAMLANAMDDDDYGDGYEDGVDAGGGDDGGGGD